MNITIIGGAGFIGTNLARLLSQDKNNKITIIDNDESYFDTLKALYLPNVRFKVGSFLLDTDFNEQVTGQNVVYHLASTNIPGNSNINIAAELEANVIVTSRLLDACVQEHVDKVVFISSGGAVYGIKDKCPVNEEMATYPITSYGIQKNTIEKLLCLYQYQAGLDYRVIRLSNPYGEYQRPNGKLGVITTFVYNAITSGHLSVYGDGSIIRDFIYIQDAIEGIKKIVDGESDYRIFNLGSGKGTSINQIIDIIRNTLRQDLTVEYSKGRSTDVPVNYLDISRYESVYGKLKLTSLQEGIIKTAEFLKSTE